MNPSEPVKAAGLLAHNFRRLREERGLTIEALNRATGLSVQRLLEIEAARRDVRLDELTLIALGLGVRIVALFDDTG